ncbi:MAG: hypothetical protein HFJ59_02125 [Clostridia bacterium]|nr:hypothetical protein [Clostridia bacterium]
MPLDSRPDKEFLEFISKESVKKEKDENGNTVSKKVTLENLEMILNLERDYPGMFIKVMTNFGEAKSHRETLNDKGKPIKVPWEEALKKFYLSNKYVGVTKENSDIAQVFGSKGLSQHTFDVASKLRQKAKTTNVPEHILEKPIREETILENIERIKNQTEQELIDGRQMIEELYDKQFTYEWLSKSDPHNSIMGLFVSCCGTITSQFYGKDIARSSVISPDVQNLVVRDSKGDIVSKGTMYMNKDKGYGVINDFELNEKYRHHESSSGRYNVEETSSEEQDREMIFKAFQRGLKAFIEEYDKQNPNKPLQQINIGMGYNRLKKQVERFKKATSNLTVPSEYSFQDAMNNQQYVLYQRIEKEIENGGYDR